MMTPRQVRLHFIPSAPPDRPVLLHSVSLTSPGRPGSGEIPHPHPTKYRHREAGIGQDTGHPSLGNEFAAEPDVIGSKPFLVEITFDWVLGVISSGLRKVSHCLSAGRHTKSCLPREYTRKTKGFEPCVLMRGMGFEPMDSFENGS